MNAKKTLLKDLGLVLLGYVIMRIFVSISGEATSMDIFFCWLCAGVVIGWKLASHIITAVGLWGILIKFILAIVIGLPATPVILIKDIIGVISEAKNTANDAADTE